MFTYDNGRIVILGGTVNASGSGTVHINAGASGSMMLVDGTTVTISGDFTLQTDFVLGLMNPSQFLSTLLSTNGQATSPKA